MIFPTMQARDTVGAGGVSKVLIILPKNSYQKDKRDNEEDTLCLIVSSCVCVCEREINLKTKQKTRSQERQQTVDMNVSHQIFI